jgi:hypothetical protein
MNVFQLNIATVKFEGGKEVYKNKVKEFRFPASADEITMRKWMDFQLRKGEAPDFFKEFERLTPDEREAKMMLWDAEVWSEFFYTVADLLSCVVDANAGELMRAMPALDEGRTSLMTLYIALSNIINGYVPVERQTFEWKGKTYLWPQKLVDQVGHTWYGQDLTTAEAVEALQVEHVYNAKDKDGVFIMADRKYHVDVALVAVMSRRVKDDGAVESVPLEYNARRKHLESRILEFQEAPMSVCLDMAFFLSNSKIALALTHTSRLRSTLMSMT